MLTAYRAGWAAFAAAAKAADPASPGLAATMVDPLLHSVIAQLVREKYEGSVVEGDVTLHPRVASIAGGTATVMDCTFDASEFVYKANGTPVPPVTTPHPSGVRSTLVEVNGVWKVKDQTNDPGACSAT